MFENECVLRLILMYLFKCVLMSFDVLFKFSIYFKYSCEMHISFFFFFVFFEWKREINVTLGEILSRGRKDGYYIGHKKGICHF